MCAMLGVKMAMNFSGCCFTLNIQPAKNLRPLADITNAILVVVEFQKLIYR